MENNNLNHQVEHVNEQLELIRKQIGTGWTALWKGMLYGLGSVIGAAVAVIIIGWFLNVIGVIPAFQRQADLWRQAFQQTQRSVSQQQQK
jgi:hypothetical protein